MSDKKIAFVTGSAQGIGRGIALKLAGDGFDVAVADLEPQREKGESVVKEIVALGRTAVFVPIDVSDKSAFDAAVDEAVSALGGLTVLVNNAGIAQIKPLLDVTPEELDKIFAINVRSAVLGIQAAVRVFDAQGVKGKIINGASIAAIQGFPILGAYSASKFAVRGITQVAAQELAPKGHTVNAYAPGIVGTSMWDQIDRELHEINGKPLGQNLQENIDTIALGRVETPDDVAGVVSFLASPNSDYVTGQVILVDGGMLYN